MKLCGLSPRTMSRIQYLRKFLRAGIRTHGNDDSNLKIHNLLKKRLDSCEKLKCIDEIHRTKKDQPALNILLIVENSNSQISDCICNSFNAISPDHVKFMVVGRLIGESTFWKNGYNLPVWEVCVDNPSKRTISTGSNYNTYLDLKLTLDGSHIPYDSLGTLKNKNKSRLGWYAYLRALVRAYSYR